MLRIKDIHKEYRTGTLVQKALDGVSLNLRDNEFVAILGPSGSGKTTLLNIIGGLDRYDSGDLIINGISTKKYKDRDWDSYRNHTIGFVFQSYNLIPHQTILANVELALTISGIGRAERKERAQEALEQVGLGEQIHKKPNQLSGGQMQRVAIARALVNDPDILLADEPTGALDSDTSVQVMELLKDVAKDRLVVMVTHNPELAYEYATRIVKLKDGKIISDSNELILDESVTEEPEHRNMGKASMSFLTALALSFNNLRTKKARTLLTAFAGSIGIIGIALILSLSTGVNDYIEQVEEETLSEYPLQIQSTGFDFSSIMVSDQGSSLQNEDGDIHVVEMVTNMFSTMDSNDLASLKAYFDSRESSVEDYTNAIEYSYSVEPQIYKENGDKIRQVHPDQSFHAMGLGSSSNSNSMMSAMMSTDVFYEMPENEQLYKGQYDVKAGRWPENYNECVVVLTSGGSMSDFLLYTLGLRDPLELDEMVEQFMNEENITVPEDMGTYDYDDILGIQFRIVNAADCYQYDGEYKVWTDKSGDDQYMKNLVEKGEKLTIVGIVQPSEDASASALTAGINYPASLTEHVAEYAAQTEIVKQQLEEPSVNVMTGEPFGEDSDEEFDMGSLFSVDEEKLQEAFGFDENAFSDLSGAVDFADVFSGAGDSVDLSGLADLSGIRVDLPDLPSVSLETLLKDLDLNVSSEGFSAMARSLIEGYRQYAAEHPEADYSGLADSFRKYLGSEAAQGILKDNITEIMQSEEGVTVTMQQLKDMLSEVMAGFGQYVQDKDLTDPDRFGEYLQEYLGTAGASEILDKWADAIFNDATGNVEITAAQLCGLAEELSDGYLQYAQQNGEPDPSRMGEYFIAYLGTADGRNRLAEGLEGAVDTAGLEKQISAAMGDYMGKVMASYGSAIGQAMETQITSVMQQVMNRLASGMSEAFGQAMTQIGSALQDAMQIDGDAFAEAFEMNMTGEEFTELMMSMSSGQSASYDNNLRTLGYVDFDEPSGINIYPKDFESKEAVVSILDDYNSRMEEEGQDEKVITYTDVVGTLMSSVTTIIDIISYVLIAFVAISLIVSSIMIGVITYISVLERRKEIGILRAIGASKKNISQVFNAETFIIGLCAGVLGILISLLLLIPGNALIHFLAGTNDVNAVLPAVPAVILIMLSVVLTLLGGLIPSKKAAKSDPVTALRTE
ncbi:MAG TPA: ABC transporter ATP-binding protein/permease [Candidatus Mediterraneibacter quadrami]|uniref:ABC transporter ATP-binding protein/permease n=1 Tax=Candidatus Mediterraneibacter quadrami TaxID=2838684 RepID=A0A9D2RFE8_9FIRM|nr:ABC transporter ATP-binding protein/permease [Candidatus Mediterraneibacter quadrami]